MSTGLGLALGGVPFAQNAVSSETSKLRDLDIVDTHQHLWDLKRFRLPWIEKGSILDRDFMHAEYAKATAGLNVVQAVYMEVDVDPSQQTAEADAVIEWCKSRDGVTVAGVISGRPERDDFKDYITKFRDGKYVKGIRRLLQHVDTPAGHAASANFVRGVRLLGELGMSFDICIPASRLDDAVKLIDDCPGTNFILDHCGCANVAEKDQSHWRRNIDAIAKRKNVDCKVSGIVTSTPRERLDAEGLAPTVNHVLDAFGPDRVIFAGDWPVCTLAASLAQWVGWLKDIVANRSEADRRKLFADNARRVYRLNG